jgi:hypothetical protein
MPIHFFNVIRLIIWISLCSEHKGCAAAAITCVLPSGCTYMGTSEIANFNYYFDITKNGQSKVNVIVCENYVTTYKFNENEDADALTTTSRSCRFGDLFYNYDLHVYVKANKKMNILVAQSNFKLFDIIRLVNSTDQVMFNFANLDGFDIKSSFKIEWPTCESYDSFLEFVGEKQTDCMYEIFLEFNNFKFDYYDVDGSSSDYKIIPLHSCDEIKNAH